MPAHQFPIVESTLPGIPPPGSGGTVASVGLSMPAQFSVAGSPVTNTGTLAVTWATQAANLVFAGPATGVPAVPTFRSLVAADIPAAGSANQFQYNGGTALAAGSILEIASGGLKTTQLYATIAAHSDKALTLAVGSSGTPGNGFGGNITWQLHNSSNVYTTAGYIACYWSNAATTTTEFEVTGRVAGVETVFARFSDANGFGIGNSTPTYLKNAGVTQFYLLPAALPGVSGYVLSCTTGGVMSWVSAASGITIGTTTITGGTSTRVLYNNAGVVGEDADFAFDGTGLGIGTAPGAAGRLIVTPRSGSIPAISCTGSTSGNMAEFDNAGTGSGIRVLTNGTTGQNGILSWMGGASFGAALRCYASAVSATATGVTMIEIDVLSNSAVAAGFGGAIKWLLESSTTNSRDAGRLCVRWTTPTDASRSTTFVLEGVSNASSLTEFMRFRFTNVTPNNTVHASVLEVVGSATNVDLVLMPKGTGAILGAVPDSATAGGNKRGDNAVDLQTVRNAASQVASGQYSVIIGGSRNTAQNTATIAMGYSADASHPGEFAWSYNPFDTTGDSQMSFLHWMGQTTNATPTALTLGNNGANTYNVEGTVYFEIRVVARRTDTDDEAAYTISGLIHNNAGTTAFTGTPTVTAVEETDVDWAVAVTANNTTDCLDITVTGDTGQTIEWTAIGWMIRQRG